MAWTKEQEAAITTRGNNILVSAGAGSGKTAVLTERITSLIKEGHSIKSLLVLTFTNAAAAEMKERVRDKLEKSDDPKCKEALKYIDTAKITTFDGYSLYLVKKYFYVLGISPDIKIANSYYLSLKCDEILDEILDKLYEENGFEINNYFQTFRDKDDLTLKRNILDMYNTLFLKLDLNSFLDNYNDFYNDENVNKLIDRFVLTIRDDIQFLIASLNNMQNLLPDGNDALYQNIEELITGLNELRTYDDIKRYLSKDNFKLKSVKNKTDEYAKAKDNQKKVLDKIRDKLVFDDTNMMKENILSTKPFSDLFIKIIKELDKKLSLFKKENNYYGFTDIAKLAIELVDKNEDIKEEIKNGFYEILIDEYQDTSDIQEEFISRIANNNLYMVGDVKQSIYRFRNANPYIFKDKYNQYKNNNGGIKIDLNKNFRSREEVLNNINTIFNSAMTNDVGDANYRLEHQMNFGLKDYNEYKSDKLKYDMDIITYNPDDYLELEEKYSNSEIEIFIIADHIKKLIESKIKIYDKSIKNDDPKKKYREIEYKDICIILDRGKSFNLFKKIFESKGIPLAINADVKLQDSDILPIVSNLINLVIAEAKEKYDEKYYHSYYSIGRSFLFELSDDELFSSVSEKKKNKERIESEVTNIAKNIAKGLYNSSPKEIYLEILNQYKVEEKLYKIGNVYESLIVLQYVMDFIENINSIGKSLFDINDYIIDLVQKDNDVKYSVSVENSPGVKIMNIHKSKGLEFPICYFAGLSVKFNSDSYESSAGYFAESGFFISPNSSTSIIKEVGIRDLRIKDISEKVRLFYVALTRTREKMILVNPETIKEPVNYKDVKSVSDILGYAHEDIEKYCKEINSLDLSKDYIFKINKNYNMYNQKPNYILNDYLGNIIEKNRISKEVIEVLSDEEQENLDYGNELHEIMEAIDFNNPDISYLDKEEYNIISNVLNNDLLKNIKNAKTYHEHEFYMTLDDKLYHGIIDLLVVYDDHIDIIDYKLKNIDHEEYNRQLDIYRKYVKTISKLPIKCYLLSLLENKIREVE